MFEVVLPVIRPDDADKLLDDIQGNQIRPTRIILIDNTGGKYYMPRTQIPVMYVRPQVPFGVNASWNIGAQLADPETKYLSILNDDIRINSQFFERIAAVFKTYTNVGAVCPQTVDDPENLESGLKCGADPMKRREGWAFTIRLSLLTQIPRIPSSLQIFCGDDWYWHWTYRRGMHWVKNTGNKIYHKAGASGDPKYVATLRAEKAEFSKLIREAA